ncbi:MAG: stage V sporulation protein AC [Sarcina ventriculi]|uniref:stage V sporulation protein AC n=1 Tax=Sarcina ventriculi TaxID=1267 RepID=UPI00073E62B8|nr:stage V sporulation protein AC [Sarcina ventriculi]MCI5636481.1 stage V sporulation protein AC [Sarcina ventriculi]MDD7373461.1 stage V sporulation protein AC [Sarcina ventriculi]MDY7062835.1 stage V sporulation protein AC [Sarcina ventriculi]SPZ50625.1 stage V sporulation protein AC [Sarcina ventriculi]
MQYKGDKEIKKDFEILSNKMKPKPKVFKNCVRAFIIGGLICVIGQFILNMLIRFGVPKDDATTWLPIIMIFIGAFLTGIGVYDKIAAIAGAGTIVPITGFSNSIVSPAMEFKKEGFVMGIGSKMFTIAGPVLVYGISTSIVIGIIYYILILIGVMGV